MVAGLVGALFYAAFGAFECTQCGKIPRSEFPPDVQRRMSIGTLLLALAAAGIAVGVLVLMASMD
jgi:uncharacterized membrane protein